LRLLPPWPGSSLFPHFPFRRNRQSYSSLRNAVLTAFAWRPRAVGGWSTIPIRSPISVATLARPPAPPQGGFVTTTPAVLAVVGEPALRDDADRAAAAAGVPIVHSPDVSSRKAWAGAAAVLLDAAAAGRCAERALPRRRHVVLVGRTEPGPADWRAAIAVGAQQLLTLPGQDSDLVTVLADAAESARAHRRRGPVVAVIGG